jgi:hypothetical protein
MSEPLTLELPDDLARQARAMAAASNRRIEDVVIDLVARGVAEPAVENLPDGELLAFCDATFPPTEQNELSNLLAAHKDGKADVAAGARLDVLMTAYRRGLVLKARAIREAVARGLIPRLTDDAA